MKPGARALPLGLVVGERDLERGVDGLRARVGEEGVVERSRERAARAGKRARTPWGGRTGRPASSRAWPPLLDGLDDRLAAVARIHAEQARGGVDHLGAVGLEVVHALGTGEQARALLEGAVGGEGNPVGLELIGLHIERGHGVLRGVGLGVGGVLAGGGAGSKLGVLEAMSDTLPPSRHRCAGHSRGFGRRATRIEAA